eukprot:1145143-Pelagomonas_calceolata.AAC.3
MCQLRSPAALAQQKAAFIYLQSKRCTATGRLHLLPVQAQQKVAAKPPPPPVPAQPARPLGRLERDSTTDQLKAMGECTCWVSFFGLRLNATSPRSRG